MIVQENSKYPLVSLLIANYNNARYITETLESAIHQTYPNIEIIIVDDASNDNSIEKINEVINLYGKNKRIILYKNFYNYGCGRNKRKCIDASQGKFFAFLDPEDTIEHSAVEQLMNVHLQNSLKYSIVYSTHYLCNEKLEVQSISDWPGKIPQGQSHLNSTAGHISAFAVCNKYFYDRTAGIDPQYIVAEDMDLYLKMEEVAPVLYVDKPIYYYRNHGNNLSWSYDKRYRNLYWRHKAEMVAYQRRKKTKTIAANLTKIQLHHKKFAFYMQYAKLHRNQKQYVKSITYNLKALLFTYTIFLRK
jgi:glycosyltransferase involved in cell wall biosynthesis